MLDLEALLAPIPGLSPAGEEAMFLQEYDDIKEARREDLVISRRPDDPPPKAANWPQVVTLASEVLTRKSKDLQIAAWLTEAATARQGFPGLIDGLHLVAGLLDRFWDGLHPHAEDNDLAQRAGRILWFDANLARRIRNTPLTSGDPDTAMTLQKRQEAGDMERLAARQPEEYQMELARGKTTPDEYEAAIADTPPDFLAGLLSQIDAAQSAFEAMKDVVAERFEGQAPALLESPLALADARGVVEELARKKGGALGSVEPPLPSGGSAPEPSSSRSAGLQALDSVDTRAAKLAALAQLAEIGAFFRRTEPHSPVALLIQQAIRWANTPLDDWLAEVIKDETTLGRLREMLGIHIRA